eukprot:357961-Chlamydomonas_euryale.AAC.1
MGAHARARARSTCALLHRWGRPSPHTQAHTCTCALSYALLHRWGKPTAAPDSGAGWRALYADADADECRAALAGAPEALRGAFADMQRAKRQACLGRAAVDDTAELPRCQAQRRLTEWR